MDRLIEIAGLSVSYGETPVLQGVDMHVDAGEIAVILGGSGCGKSTLLKTIIGLIEPRSGRVELLGESLPDLDEASQQALLQRIGIMFQYGALLNSLTVAENVALPLQMHRTLDPELTVDIVRARLHLVGLDHAYNLLPTELSGGMRKRAALARALAMDPEVLFCDEPGAGLDPITAAGIDDLLLTLNRSLDTTIVIVTHELLSIERLAGRLIMLEEGRVAFTGSVADAKHCDIDTVANFFEPGFKVRG